MNYTQDTRNEPAFPCAEGPIGPEGRAAYAPASGITVREYFAAEAMKAIVQSIPRGDSFSYDGIASEAVKLADATLNALGRGIVEREDFPF